MTGTTRRKALTVLGSYRILRAEAPEKRDVPRFSGTEHGRKFGILAPQAVGLRDLKSGANSCGGEEREAESQRRSGSSSRSRLRLRSTQDWREKVSSAFSALALPLRMDPHHSHPHTTSSSPEEGPSQGRAMCDSISPNRMHNNGWTQKVVHRVSYATIVPGESM